MGDELTEIGFVIKTHGVKGQLRITFNENIKELSVSEALYFLVKGVKMPYFIQQIEYFKDGDALVQVEELNNKEDAEYFTKKPVFGSKDYQLEEDEEEVTPFLGYQVMDEIAGEIGTVIGYSDMGDYELIEVNFNGKDIMIPIHEDIIISIDEEKNILYLRIPDGLLDL